MEFYIELTNDISTFRLQIDKSWREIATREIVNSDFLTSDVCELIKLQEVDGELTLGNKKWNLNPTSTTFGDKTNLHYDIYAIRRIQPPTPSREQLISVIAQGDDRISNSLILNIYGLFELRDMNTLNISFQDPTIILRNETFSANNNYVGVTASNDQRLIEDLYAKSLDSWLAHLQNGVTNMYSDLDVNQTSNELFEEIENLRNVII